MKPKHLFLAIAALLTAGGLWLARTTWRPHAPQKSSMDVGFKTPQGPSKPGQMLNSPNPGHTLAPPNPMRRFTDFTPEQRVEFARKGHGPGG
ncbi:MAG TPA: hypothetical protein VGR78_06760 [Verrucomicrobiae bacterium]|jgi:hypothetical protein|nr:hypothetical protein [Verrucomicrobiae bacterium]